MSDVKKQKEFEKELANIIANSHLNILFGAGVNGNLFPAINDSNDFLVKELKNKIIDLEINSDLSLENSISYHISKHSSKKDEIFDKIKNIFKELNEQSMKKINDNNDSFQNFKNLLSQIIFLLENSNNNEPKYKVINIFTLNYDSILERILKELNVYFEVYDSSNILGKFEFIDSILYNYEKHTYLLKINVIKLHGNIENQIIIPSSYKYDDILNSKHFELLSTFKNKILKENSLLIILGYGFKDEHINNLILNSHNHRSIIYDFQYLNKNNENKDKFIEKLKNKNNIRTIIVNDINDKEKKDSTKYFLEIISKGKNDNE